MEVLEERDWLDAGPVGKDQILGVAYAQTVHPPAPVSEADDVTHEATEIGGVDVDDLLDVIGQLPAGLRADLAERLRVAVAQPKTAADGLPSQESVLTATARQIGRALDWREAAAEDAVSGEQWREFRWDEDYVQSARDAREMIAVSWNDTWIVPRWQLDSDGEVLPGVADLIRAFPAGYSALASWSVRPNGDLGGLVPRDLITRGDWEPVVAVAHMYRSRTRG